MTLRCLEPSGNGAEGTRSQWGTAGSAEEPSPEAARLAKALRELSQTGWYWGSMTVNEAKEKLKEAPEGTFLIRDSSHSDYLLTISVKTSAGPTNLRIEYQDGKFRLDSIICVKSKLKQFDSVVHLIDYYVQMCKDKRTGPEAPRNGTVHLYLTKPLYTSAPALQHLCRLTINKCTGTIWGLPLPTRLKDYLEEYKFQHCPFSSSDTALLAIRYTSVKDSDYILLEVIPLETLWEMFWNKARVKLTFGSTDAHFPRKAGFHTGWCQLTTLLS
ncbi:Suppressor Of Cytokine Signaling 2 [Manis pentadactyla]|nr:Suppressor Of Cytokine Signaling 2 [Manis pentadactyla]